MWYPQTWDINDKKTYEILHSIGYLHFDFKPDNMMFNNSESNIVKYQPN